MIVAMLHPESSGCKEQLSKPILSAMATTAAKKLASRLKQLRKEHGLTQQAAATRCRIKYKYYQEHESGKPRDVRLSTLERMAKGFDVTLSKLFDFD